MWDIQPGHDEAMYAGNTAMGRVGAPQEIADAAVS